MKKWGRRIRGAIGMGLAWGAAGFGAGILLARVPGFYSDLPFALLFAPLGFFAGIIFSGILVAIGGRCRFDRMSLSRFAGWGAVSGLLLSGIFVVGNVGSEGAAAALRAANVSDRVKVVQYDASPPQVDQLKQGVLDALIAQDPYQEGVSAVDQAVNAVLGKPVETVIQTGLKYVYKTEC